MTWMMAGGSKDEPGGGEDERCLVAARVDPDAFVEFYDRRYARVAAFFYRRILCPFTTAELTAETFARVWATRHRFDPGKGTAMAWTMGIAGNLYRQWSHKGVVDRSTRAKLAIETPPLVDEDLEHIEALADLGSLREQLRSALDQLSPRLREAVVLRVANDLPYEEVARRLGCTVGAARVRVSRGLELLFDVMEGAR
jgi:RNA polymerase sigma-70 factor (ECF subfamily)